MVFVLLIEIFNKVIDFFILVYDVWIGFVYGMMVFLVGVLLIVLIDYLILNLYESLDK